MLPLPSLEDPYRCIPHRQPYPLSSSLSVTLIPSHLLPLYQHTYALLRLPTNPHIALTYLTTYLQASEQDSRAEELRQQRDEERRMDEMTALVIPVPNLMQVNTNTIPYMHE